MKKVVSVVLACFALACCPGLFAACGEGEDAPAHTHTMTLHAAVEAGCTESGSVAYWECGGCGKKFADEAGEQELTDVALPALGHDYEWTVTKEATCTEAGTRTGVCSRCEGEKTEPIAALEHAFGEWAVVTPAGCESAGSATFEAARLYARLETETFAGYSQDASTWGTGNQVSYGGLVACGTAQVKFVNSCYCVGDARISAADPYKIGIYAYGENVSVDFSEATYLTIDNVFVNFGDTADVTGYSGTVSDSWNGTAFADSDAAA